MLCLCIKLSPPSVSSTSRYHIPFPVAGRSSFGIWGTLQLFCPWNSPTLARISMASVQPRRYGSDLVRSASLDRRYISSAIKPKPDASPGTCVYLMIRSIWSSWQNIPNGLPTSSGTNTRDFASFFLFWLCSLPAIWFPVHKIRHLFTVKAYFVPCAGLAFFVWYDSFRAVLLPLTIP